MLYPKLRTRAWVLALCTGAALCGARLHAAVAAGEPLPDPEAPSYDSGTFDNWRPRTLYAGSDLEVTVSEPQNWITDNGRYIDPVDLTVFTDIFTQVPGRTGLAVQGVVPAITNSATDRKEGVGIHMSLGPLVAEDEPVSLNEAGGIPISRRYSQLTGYYQFLPKGKDLVAIRVDVYSGGTMIGQGGATTKSKQAKWKKFKAPIIYFGTGEPDRLIVGINLLGPEQRRGGFKSPKPGSMFRVDELQLVP